jgi:hypothetical protein
LRAGSGLSVWVAGALSTIAGGQLAFRRGLAIMTIRATMQSTSNIIPKPSNSSKGPPFTKPQKNPMKKAITKGKTAQPFHPRFQAAIVNPISSISSIFVLLLLFISYNVIMIV